MAQIAETLRFAGLFRKEPQKGTKGAKPLRKPFVPFVLFVAYLFLT